VTITAKFLYEDGKPVPGLNTAILDKNKINSIMALEMYDTISLGKGIEKQAFRVVKISRRFVSMIFGAGKDNLHFDVVVRTI
jgi:hypothetical protein